MAFVTSTPLVASVRSPTTTSTTTSSFGSSFRPSFASATALPKSSSPTNNAVRMGYGDYSYLTDKTKGQVNQYYVDKFRNIADLAKGPPATDADSMVGANAKGGIAVPKQGIPQLENTAEIPIDYTNVEPDPRILESEGKLYPWDINYEDPKFAPSTYANLDDEEVSDMALSQFRASVAPDRQAMLTAMDFGAVSRVNRIKDGMDEQYMLTLDGQLDIAYAKLQKVSNPPFLNPTGIPQTELPGFPYTPAVGALDLQEKPGDSFTFWKTESETSATSYKKPSGANTPELPYNAPPSVDALKEAQDARDIVPKWD